MDYYGESKGGAPPQYAECVAASPPYPPPPGGYVNQGASPPVFAQPVGQPQIVYVQSPVISENEAPDHLVLAILVTIFCCWPLGIVGIIKSNECRSARQRGDRDAALRLGSEAKKFSLIAIGCGIAIFVLVGACYGISVAVMIARINAINEINEINQDNK